MYLLIYIYILYLIRHITVCPSFQLECTRILNERTWCTPWGKGSGMRKRKATSIVYYSV